MSSFRGDGHALPCFSQQNKLRETTVAPGLKLKMNSERVEFVGTTENTLPPSIVMEKYDKRIPTDNPNLIVIEKRYRLYVYSNKGELLSKFPVDSLRIFIPKSKDVIWVQGKVWGDGSPDDGKEPPPAGIKVYDKWGHIINSWSKEQLRGVRVIGEIDDGTLYVLANTPLRTAQKGYTLYQMSATAEVLRQLPWTGYLTEAKLLNNGNFIALQDVGIGDKRWITQLLDKNGTLVAEYSGNNESRPRIIPVPDDSKYFVLGKRTRKQYESVIEVYSLSNLRTPKKKVTVTDLPANLLLDDNLQTFVTVTPADDDIPGYAYLLEVIDSSGTIQAQYRCPQRKDQIGISHDADQKYATWKCGDRKIKLKLK
ncbi:MAG: hypothetical protein GX410_08390 [Elusimicrobia bacterium]|nr:hypothetical protein [Elusimicrobiota bacterium]